MALVPNRYRERLSPPPPNNKVRAGVRLLRRRSDGVVVQTTNFDISGLAVPQLIEKVWDSKNPGPPYTQGGDFMSIKAHLPQFEMQGVGTYRTVPDHADQNYYYEYRGGFLNPDFSSDPVSVLSYTKMGQEFPPNPVLIPHIGAYCSEVYNKLKPKIAKADLAVDLAEARDIPRMMQASAKSFHQAWRAMGGHRTAYQMLPKRVADNFINLQFGWKPFINSLKRFDDTFRNAAKYIGQIRRDNGRWVKRLRTISEMESITPITTLYSPGIEPAGAWVDDMCRPMTVNGNTCYGYFSITEEIYTQVWAEGSFKYYRPEFDLSRPDHMSGWNNLQRQLAIYGARINPSVVWEATPWSWAIDYFTNVGKVIDNASAIAQDSMVARYLYLMHHNVRRIVFRGVRNFWQGPQTFEWHRIADVKQRAEASNPYDMCLKWRDLTPQQLAILWAVGLSKPRFHP